MSPATIAGAALDQNTNNEPASASSRYGSNRRRPPRRKQITRVESERPHGRNLAAAVDEHRTEHHWAMLEIITRTASAGRRARAAFRRVTQPRTRQPTMVAGVTDFGDAVDERKGVLRIGAKS
jgi:hypothetical protein